MTERRLLQVIVVLLVAIVVIAVVPGPFEQCERRDTGLTEESIFGLDQSIYVRECVDSWWPIGATAVTWIPKSRPPIPTLRPGQTPVPFGTRKVIDLPPPPRVTVEPLPTPTGPIVLETLAP